LRFLFFFAAALEVPLALAVLVLASLDLACRLRAWCKTASATNNCRSVLQQNEKR
jgi:hypothetical protein